LPGNPYLNAALDAAAAGFHVCPLAPGAKNPPLWAKFFERATTDPDKVTAAWNTNPAANIAIACGRGLIVIDADGADADATVRSLIGEPTTTARTPRGRHYYLRGAGTNCVGVLPKIDVRARGGYVVAPGSIVKGAGRYEWEISPWDVPPIPMPLAVAKFLDVDQARRTTSRGKRALHRNAGCINEGERNHTLTSLAGRLRQTALSPEAIRAALHVENRRRCQPQLDECEVDRIASSAARWDAPPAWLIAPLAFANDEGLSSSDRHVLIALCSHANDQGRAHPGIDRLASMTGYSRPTVISAIKRLENAGRISVTRARRTVNRYQLLEWTPGAR
jgi:hypothetical protein